MVTDLCYIYGHKYLIFADRHRLPLWQTLLLKRHETVYEPGFVPVGSPTSDRDSPFQSLEYREFLEDWGYQKMLIFPRVMRLSISSPTIPPDSKGAKALPPGDNHCVQKPSLRDKTGIQKPHPRNIKLENFTNVSMNSDTI